MYNQGSNAKSKKKDVKTICNEIIFPITCCTCTNKEGNGLGLSMFCQVSYMNNDQILSICSLNLPQLPFLLHSHHSLWVESLELSSGLPC